MKYEYQKHCNTVQDLLPLYVDEVCSEETRQMIEEHLAQCPECRMAYKTLTDPLLRAQQRREEERRAFAAQVQKRERKFRWKKAVRSVGCTLLVLLLLMMTINEFWPYDYASNYLSFSAIANHFRAGGVMRTIRAGDGDGFVDKYMDTKDLYQQYVDVLDALDAMEKTQDTPVGYVVEIGGETCWVSQAIYENEYATWLQTGNEYDFWMRMIEQNQPVVPEAAFNYIADAPEYRDRIYEQFHFEEDYASNEADYLRYIYQPYIAEDGKGDAWKFALEPGYVYLKTFKQNNKYLYQDNWSNAVTFPWLMEQKEAYQNEQDLKAQLRYGEWRAEAQQVVDMGYEAFDAYCREQAEAFLRPLSENDVKIARYTKRLLGDDLCLTIYLEDLRGEEKYAELSEAPALELYLYKDKKSKGIDGFTITKGQGRLAWEFIEEREIKTGRIQLYCSGRSPLWQGRLK